MTSTQPKIIVLDDDPTGSQTVHSCLLLMRWDLKTLCQGLTDEAPICFILTNTRAMSPEQAQEVTKSVCQNLQKAIAAVGIEDFLIVSRSDSTLRGHYPIETDAIAKELGDFDAHFLTPAFFEGGRVTIDSVHYLLIDGVKTPVAETEFAKDSVFGYHSSYLPDYVAEKTAGKIPASKVTRLLLSDLRNNNFLEQLQQLNNNQCVVVDGETQADYDVFAEAILASAATGKRYLFRSAASLLTSLAQLGSQPIPPQAMAQYKPTKQPGIVLVGSHVKKTTQQLDKLLAQPETKGIEIDITRLRDDPTQRNILLTETLHLTEQAFKLGQTPVIYTTRQELSFDNIQARLDFGVLVSSLLMAIVQKLPKDLSFLISKGGITSNDVLSTGLNLQAAKLLGQILPGCSLVRTPATHPQFPNLPVVLFPGNVGDEEGLVTVWHRLTNSNH